MLLGAAASGAVCLMLALATRRRHDPVSWFAWWGLLWAVVVIGLVTLVPAEGAPGIVSSDGRLTHCSRDIGGPAPEGFWIFDGGQRMLNTALFVPAGTLWVLAVARSWRGALLAPLGLAGLALYSAVIEKTQLEVARIDRACDYTDVIDNVTGAAIGALVGVGLALVLLPWRAKP